MTEIQNPKQGYYIGKKNISIYQSCFGHWIFEFGIYSNIENLVLWARILYFHSNTAWLLFVLVKVKDRGKQCTACITL